MIKYKKKWVPQKVNLKPLHARMDRQSVKLRDQRSRIMALEAMVARLVTASEEMVRESEGS